MKTASDPTLTKMHKKINELVQDANVSLNSQIKVQNDLVELKKEIEYLKRAVRNF